MTYVNHQRELHYKITQLINEQQIKEAESLLSDYEELYGETEETLSMKAITRIIQGNLFESQLLLERGTIDFPNSADMYFNLGYVYSMQADSVRAMEAYCKGRLLDQNAKVSFADLVKTPISSPSSLRVLHGTMEIANQMNELTRGLNHLGVCAETVNYYPNYLNYRSDNVFDLNSLPESQRIKRTRDLAAQFISSYDIFHFHFGTSLTQENADLPLIKELKKKVYMHHWGSDVRLISRALKLNPYSRVKTTNEQEIMRHLEFLSRFIDSSIVADWELYEYVKDFYKKIYLIPQAINTDLYIPKPQQKKKRFLIVHAPTSPEIKGTQYIIKAIDTLKLNYQLDFKLVQGISHSEAMKIYQQADLIIDQILLGSYGLFALEAMSMGKPVICWLTDFMLSKYPADLPLISANPDNIRDVLENILKNRDMLIPLGQRGRDYVVKYHDYRAVAKKLLSLYQSA